MLSPPKDLPEAVASSALVGGWVLTVDSMIYRPVGFGSHHWEVTDVEGGRWFVTVDELETKRRSRDEPLDTAFDRLRAALWAATELRRHGRAFVLAPVATRAGEPLVRVMDRFGLAVYPFVPGESFGWGEFATPAHRLAVLDLVAAVHTAPDAVRRHAGSDDFAVAYRDELEAALRGDAAVASGPYAEPVAQLLADHAEPVRRLIARYDELVRAAHAQQSRAVLTHGEPHPGNTMRTPDGWLLIDWDTALVAPPERDLWLLDPGDGSVLDRYADATGVAPQPAMVDLYRIRWDLADLAVDTARFRRPHVGSLDDDQSWDILRSLVERISREDRARDVPPSDRLADGPDHEGVHVDPAGLADRPDDRVGELVGAEQPPLGEVP